MVYLYAIFTCTNPVAKNHNSSSSCHSEPKKTLSNPTCPLKLQLSCKQTYPIFKKLITIITQPIQSHQLHLVHIRSNLLPRRHNSGPEIVLWHNNHNSSMLRRNTSFQGPQYRSCKKPTKKTTIKQRQKLPPKKLQPSLKTTNKKQITLRYSYNFLISKMC